MMRILVIGSLLVAATAAQGVDLTGWWRAQLSGSTLEFSEFVFVTQTGDSVTIPLTFPGARHLTGTISGIGGFTLGGADNPCVQSELQGRLLPGATFIDGEFVCYLGGPSLGIERLTLTRCSCHDGNAADGDGCDASCQVEPCYTCAGLPSVCTPTPDGGACDDGRDCTTGETCSGGVCGGGSPVVPCTDMTGLWSVTSTDGSSSSAASLAKAVQRDGIVTLGGIGTGYHGTVDTIGAIDLATGSFDVEFLTGLSIVIGCPPFGTLTGTAGATAFAAEEDEYIWRGHPSCEGFGFFLNGTRIPCGNGVIDPGEACDDGNDVAGDGCDRTCAVEPCFACSGEPSACTRTVGAPCDDGDGNQCTSGVCTSSTCAGVAVQDGTACNDFQPCTTGDVCSAGTCVGVPTVCLPCRACDRTGACVPAPRTGCLASLAPEHSVLTLRSALDHSSLAWTWSRGASTPPSDLGDPTTTSDYALCLFSEATASPAALLGAVAPAASSCGAQPCWSARRAGGFEYEDGQATHAGLQSLVARPGEAGKAKVKVKGKGALLEIPALPLRVPLRLQLQVENGACFEARYEAGGVLVNDAARGRFKARGAP